MRSFAFVIATLLPWQVLADRAPGSGLYAIWYGRDTALLDLPFLAGGQAIAQWKAVEPQPGHYDFSSLDRQLQPLRERGFKATVQINGNNKPDYLFQQVPYYPERLSNQVQDKPGTLMFWHPAHAAAYQRLIQALGEYLKTTSYRDTVLGVRLNFNAFGTEHTNLPPGKARQANAWITPPGVAPGTDWSQEAVHGYEAMVFAAYLSQIAPQTRVFVRNGLPEDIAKDYRDDFLSGRLSWFHTSSEVEPRTGSEWRYRRFYDDCRSGHTTAYAEPWASAWGYHGGAADDRACSPPQWNYWRLLFDLHNGVSFIALYGDDLRVARDGTYRAGKRLLHDDAADGTDYRGEFTQAFEFAARYAGYHASPETSPGAWFAFRDNDTIREANGRPPAARRLTFYTGDYTFLMERQPDQSKPLGTTGPEDQRYGAWARELPAGATMTLRLDSTFAKSLAGKPATVRLVYLSGTGTFQFSGETHPVPATDGERWQVRELPVATWQGDTVQVTATQTPLILHMVEVCRGQPAHE